MHENARLRKRSQPLPRRSGSLGRSALQMTSWRHVHLENHVYLEGFVLSRITVPDWIEALSGHWALPGGAQRIRFHQARDGL